MAVTNAVRLLLSLVTLAWPGQARAACPAPGSNQIVLYTGGNFTGDCRVLNRGAYAFSSVFGLPNDKISSIKVGTSVRTVLFKNANFTGEESLYESGSYEVMGRNENDEVSAVLVTSNGASRAAFRYLGSSPSKMSGRWAKSAQGLAHDSTSWYVTQKDHIWKYDIGADLGRSAALKKVGMPWQLSQRGCDHFGDPHVARGYLLVPIEGCWKASVGSVVYLAVFDAQLNLICYGDLWKQEHGPNNTNAGWVAVDPVSGYLYSSGKFLNSANPLRTYQIDWTAIYFDFNPHALLHDTPIGDRQLFRQDGTSIDLKTIQGGVFSDDGKLFYLTSGAADCGADENGTDRGGLRVFRADNGRLIAKAGNGYGYFSYENHCGFSDYEEPEGLDYVDMNGRRGPYFGQLHVLLLQNGILESEVYLKHYNQY